MEQGVERNQWQPLSVSFGIPDVRAMQSAAGNFYFWQSTLLDVAVSN